MARDARSHSDLELGAGTLLDRDAVVCIHSSRGSHGDALEAWLDGQRAPEARSAEHRAISFERETVRRIAVQTEREPRYSPVEPGEERLRGRSSIVERCELIEDGLRVLPRRYDVPRFLFSEREVEESPYARLESLALRELRDGFRICAAEKRGAPIAEERVGDRAHGSVFRSRYRRPRGRERERDRTGAKPT